MIKKMIVVAAFVGISSSVFAATSGTACTAGTPTAFTAGTDEFVVASFSPKCSPNVNASYAQSGTVFAVSAGSSKGKNYFSGNTTGGGVTVDSACPTTGCTLTDTASKATAKLSASS